MSLISKAFAPDSIFGEGQGIVIIVSGRCDFAKSEREIQFRDDERNLRPRCSSPLAVRALLRHPFDHSLALLALLRVWHRTALPIFR
jgi:hypothetical protein